MSEEEYNINIKSIKCDECSFTFFTHYPNKTKCQTCKKDNENSTTVKE